MYGISLQGGGPVFRHKWGYCEDGMFIAPRIQIAALVNYVAASHFVATPTPCYIPFVGACCYLPLLQVLGRNMPHKKINCHKGVCRKPVNSVQAFAAEWQPMHVTRGPNK